MDYMTLLISFWVIVHWGLICAKGRSSCWYLGRMFDGLECAQLAALRSVRPWAATWWREFRKLWRAEMRRSRPTVLRRVRQRERPVELAS